MAPDCPPSGANKLPKMPHILSQMPSLEDLRLGRNSISALMAVQTMKMVLADGREKEVVVETFKLVSPSNGRVGSDFLESNSTARTQMANLECLSLALNQLAKLPKDIWRLPRLKSLNLRGNRLTALDDDIERCGNTLQELNLDDNKLSELPQCLAQFRALGKLTVSNNLLKELPDVPNLMELQARKNRLKILPPSVFKHADSGLLELLDVRDNPLPETPPNYLLRPPELQQFVLKLNGGKSKRDKVGGERRSGKGRGKSSKEAADAPKTMEGEAAKSRSKRDKGSGSGNKTFSKIGSPKERRNGETKRGSRKSDTKGDDSDKIDSAGSSRVTEWIDQGATDFDSLEDLSVSDTQQDEAAHSKSASQRSRLKQKKELLAAERNERAVAAEREQAQAK
eukprot:SAG31_NODE_6932_length_1845_cov_1.213058_1_plen_396_part_10